jgi:hypothetical protein
MAWSGYWVSFDSGPRHSEFPRFFLDRPIKIFFLAVCNSSPGAREAQGLCHADKTAVPEIQSP